MTTND